MKKIVIAALSLISVQAFAQESHANREGKKFDIGIMPIGFPVAPILSQGISAGYYLGSDMIIEGEFTTGKIEGLSSSRSSTENGVKTEDSYSAEFISRTYGLKLKNFWGNSFYSNAGLTMRKIGVEGKATYILNNQVAYKDKEISFSADSLTLDLAIGNKWQFENFNIGCDWFGALIPISTSTQDNVEKEVSAANSKAYEEFKDGLEKLGKTTTYQLVKFYVGMSF